MTFVSTPWTDANEQMIQPLHAGTCYAVQFSLYHVRIERWPGQRKMLLRSMELS